jgi:hypothetical protein
MKNISTVGTPASDVHTKELLFIYSSCTLSLREAADVDSTTKKLLERLEEIDKERSRLRRERDAITTALSVAGIRPPEASERVYTNQESQYVTQRPFVDISLTDACMSVLRDQQQTWFTKTQVEYLVARGGYVFDSKDSVNSVNITLRRLADEGLCEARPGKGSRPSKYRFVRERE